MEISRVKYSVLLVGTLFLCVGHHFALLPCLATDHIVGANRGWQPPANAGAEAHLNYTNWAAAQKFYLDDEICKCSATQTHQFFTHMLESAPIFSTGI